MKQVQLKAMMCISDVAVSRFCTGLYVVCMMLGQAILLLCGIVASHTCTAWHFAAVQGQKPGTLHKLQYNNSVTSAVMAHMR